MVTLIIPNTSPPKQQQPNQPPYTSQYDYSYEWVTQ
jgi:hypothetical protein